MKTNRKNVVLLTLIFIILVIVFFGQAIKYIKSKNAYSIIDINKESENKSFNLSNINNFNVFDDYILCSSSQNISTYNLEGTKMWDKSLKNDTDSILTSDKQVYIVNKQENLIVCIDLYGKEVWKKQLEGSIINIHCSNDCIFTLIENNEGDEQICIIDVSGKTIFKSDINEGRYLCGYNYNKKYALSFIKIEGDIYKSVLSVYNNEGKVMFSNSIDEQIVQNVLFMNDDEILITTDKKILLMQNQNLLWSKELEGKLYDITCINDYIYVLFKDSEQYVEKISSEGKVKSRIKLDSEYNKLYMQNKNIYLIGKKSIMIIDKNLKQNVRYCSKEEIADFDINNNKLYLLILNNIKILNIK